jgi:hypothetical protein
LSDELFDIDATFDQQEFNAPVPLKVSVNGLPQLPLMVYAALPTLESV